MTETDEWNAWTREAMTVSADNVGQALKGLPLRARLAVRGLLRLEIGSLAFQIPDGRKMLILGRKAGPNAIVLLRNWKLAMAAPVQGTIGVAETYIDGDWDSPDVGALLELFLVNEEAAHNYSRGRSRLMRLGERIRHWMNANTKTGSKRNISAHYDLGNPFYEQWLDPSMTYSSALYSTGANSLETAQEAKYKALAEAAGIGAGDHVLEIGCGWGGFAEFAAGKLGAKVTGLTISQEQFDFASARIQKAGLNERVDLHLRDYRDERGRYDHIASIEMFEAVGERYWPVYFSKLAENLREGGRAALQVITIRPEAFDAYRRSPDFIQKYIFPGGMLPTRRHLEDLAAKVGMSLKSDLPFGHDYARTLSDWRERFRASWDRIVPLGFDQRFKRLWEFYLIYCEVGFRVGNIDVHQVTFGKR